MNLLLIVGIFVAAVAVLFVFVGKDVFVSSGLGDPELSAVAACVSACKSSALDLSVGPCLLDPIEGTDWVCDVSHFPREDVDNNPINQCKTFQNGPSAHFVEVNPDCGLIRSG